MHVCKSCALPIRDLIILRPSGDIGTNPPSIPRGKYSLCWWFLEEQSFKSPYNNVWAILNVLEIFAVIIDGVFCTILGLLLFCLLMLFLQTLDMLFHSLSCLCGQPDPGHSIWCKRRKESYLIGMPLADCWRTIAVNSLGRHVFAQGLGEGGGLASQSPRCKDWKPEASGSAETPVPFKCRAWDPQLTALLQERAPV